MPIAPFPHHYTVTLAGGELASGDRQPIRGGVPPQFGGSDDVWSPEELLVAAAVLCLETTFRAYARRERITAQDWRARATGILDKGPGGPTFTAIEISVDLVVADGEEVRARALLEKAERDCIISRALVAPVRLTAAITGGGTHAAAS